MLPDRSEPLKRFLKAENLQNVQNSRILACRCVPANAWNAGYLDVMRFYIGSSDPKTIAPPTSYKEAGIGPHTASS